MNFINKKCIIFNKFYTIFKKKSNNNNINRYKIINKKGENPF